MLEFLIWMGNNSFVRNQLQHERENVRERVQVRVVAYVLFFVVVAVRENGQVASEWEIRADLIYLCIEALLFRMDQLAQLVALTPYHAQVLGSSPQDCLFRVGFRLHNHLHHPLIFWRILILAYYLFGLFKFPI